MKKIAVLAMILIALIALPVWADDLSDVMNSGVLRFGTSPDYVPFVFYDESDTLTGIDVELMNEIGRRMGVRVEVLDLAFDGLIDSLNIGQVDVIGGALSKTDSRAEVIDFTRIYYKGDAQFICKSSTAVPAQVSIESFRGKKIGVQIGTSFDQWVKSNLVAGGYVSTRDVFAYSKISDAVNGLNRGTVDYVLMDQDVFEDLYKASGEYKIFYDGFASENYAFGSRKNSSLTAVINNHLTDMIKDGTAQKIANDFFSRKYTKAEVTIKRPEQIATPIPVIYPTAAPVYPTAAPVYPTAQPYPGPCVNSMSFVADITITDGHQVAPGEHFTKIWRVYNNGSCTWDPSYTFNYVSGSQMSGKGISIPRTVAPGQTVDLAVDLKAPKDQGTHKGYWQMRSPQGQNFGQTIWVKVRVNGDSPQPKPKPTAAPTDMPITHPNINYFEPDYYKGDPGDCPCIYWSAKDTQMVEITIDGRTYYKGTDASGSGCYCDAFATTGNHLVEMHAFSIWDDAFASFTYKTKELIVYEENTNYLDDYVVPDTHYDEDTNYLDDLSVPDTYYEEDTNYLDDLEIPDSYYEEDTDYSEE